MPRLHIQKVNALPSVLETNTVYLLKKPDSDYLQFFVSDNAGTHIKRLIADYDLDNVIEQNTTELPIPNKLPITTSSGLLNSGWLNPIPNVTSASLHRSPNAIVALFIYDATKDSDGGAWADGCHRTSWYNETLSGKWLGRLANEAGARAVSGAATNDYYQQTSDGKFYKLNAGTGVTEVFRGNKASFPKIVAIVAESASITLYDLTEPNYPMWMRFKPASSSAVGMDVLGTGSSVTAIKMINGIMCVGTSADYGFSIINFPLDYIDKPYNSKNDAIANRNIANTAVTGALSYSVSNPPIFGIKGIAMVLDTLAILEGNLPRPTIFVVDSSYNYRKYDYTMVLGAPATYTNGSTIATTTRVMLIGTTSYSLYVFECTYGAKNLYKIEYTPGNAPHSNYVSIKNIIPISFNKFGILDNDAGIKLLIPIPNTFSKSLTHKVTSTEQTGWLVGDIKRCYIANNSILDTSGYVIPSVTKSSLVQRLGGNSYAYSVTDLGNGTVLAGTYGSGEIYRSTDYGTTWTLAQRLGTEIFARCICYLGDGVVLAGSGNTGQIYRSTDYGLTFTLVQRLGTELQIYNLVYLGTGIVLAGTTPTGQIYRSTDYGLTFTLIQQLGTESSVQSLAYLETGIVVAGTGDGGNIYRSTDYGVSFTLAQTLTGQVQVRTLCYLGNGIVLAGTANGGKIYRSTDYGVTFTFVKTLGISEYISSMCYLGNNVVLAGTQNNGQIYLSIDGGQTFSVFYKLYNQTIIMSMCKLSNGLVLIGTASTGYIHKLSLPMITGSLTKAPVATNADLTAYSGFSNANYIREPYSADLDFGTNEWHMSAWIKVPITADGRLNQTSRTYRGMTVFGTDVYACVQTGDIYKQTNGTGNFIALNQTVRQWIGMTATTTDVYACVYGGDIYKQTNGIGDFLPLGQTSRNWTALTTLGTNVYACVNGGDIYKQTNGTGDFLPLSQTSRPWYGMTTLGTNVYACSVAGGDIYKQTNGTGDFLPLGQASLSWMGMAAVGNDVYAIINGTGDIYKQTNGTGNFVAIGQINRWWSSITGLGTYIYAGVSSGDIYKYNTDTAIVVERSHSTGPNIQLGSTLTCGLKASVYDGTSTRSVVTPTSFYINTDAWAKVDVCYLSNGSLSLYVNGVKQGTTYGAPLLTLNNSNAVLTIGNNYALTSAFPGSITHVKISGTVPTPDQIVYAYAEEKFLFNENAKCVLPDNNTLIDLAYDDGSEVWTAITNTHKTTWSGLVRVGYTPVSQGFYSMCQTKSSIALEARTSNNPGVDVSLPSKNLLSIMSPYVRKSPPVYFNYTGGFTANITSGSTTITNITSYKIPDETTYYGATISGTGIQTDTLLQAIESTTGYISKTATSTASNVQMSFKEFILPIGFTVLDVYVDGAKKQEGSTKTYTVYFDGFREVVKFVSAPAYNAWIRIYAIYKLS